MPLEGHYTRQTTPLYKLSPREVKAAATIFVVTLVAMVAVVIATVGDSNPPTPQGCIRTEVAGVVGSETISGCGAEAEAKCAHAAQFDGPRSETVVAECEAQGVPLTGRSDDPSLTRRKG
ncbi:MAG TPA: hypothetical protein VFS26_06010 [Solirubrobacterales bacterium]|nr:hypothetical protein [Solirubrobacterales bacterium]